MHRDLAWQTKVLPARILYHTPAIAFVDNAGWQWLSARLLNRRYEPIDDIGTLTAAAVLDTLLSLEQVYISARRAA